MSTAPAHILIPAKGGSTRIPGKNLQEITPGVSLLEWTVQNYRRWFPETPIHIATDCVDIKRLAVSLGCQLYGLTREDLDDKRTGTELLCEFLAVYPERPVLLAQTVAPFTFRSEVLAALDSGLPVCRSGHAMTLHTPHNAGVLSQDIEPTSVVSGNFIIVSDDKIPWRDWLQPQYRAPVSWLSRLDINTAGDLEQARMIARGVTQAELDN